MTENNDDENNEMNDDENKQQCYNSLILQYLIYIAMVCRV